MATAADGLAVHLAGWRHPAACAHIHLLCPKVPRPLSFNQALPPARRPLLSKVATFYMLSSAAGFQGGSPRAKLRNTQSC